MSSFRNRLTKIVFEKKPRWKQWPRPVEDARNRRWNILRGDKVQVIDSGHIEHGKQGVVAQVKRKINMVIVQGLNLETRAVEADPERGIPAREELVEGDIPYSMVGLVDPVTGKPCRVFRKVLADGTKVRVSNKSGAIIPRPDILTRRRTPLSSIVTESCTGEDDAWERTFFPKAGQNFPCLDYLVPKKEA
jgi:large subunit ribosomal protein L24